ncbi:hypothetical protein [Mucilaginibacter psychrotolerans]|uniref:Uncharacterized protein n=1 Tax=Mucilaginibacter psychrotolerans TaxID=1524096 RepID=A0A4Y8SIP3_9SPHI|nr:hypothetical protein [Mucilaginibacter psychrotolerans]TFF38286.1 hypothetical protein E2R66_09640 [Mucilaginibacter psychrotolerans]
MGQEITAILTNQKLSIPKVVVHFQEGECLIIPVNLGFSATSELIQSAANFDSWTDFIAFVNDNENGRKRDDDSWSIEDLIALIRSLGLHTFIIEHYSEWAGIPADYCFAAVIEDSVIRESIVDGQTDWVNSSRIESYYGLMGLSGYWVANEDRYFSFRQAARSYRKLNN